MTRETVDMQNAGQVHKTKLKASQSCLNGTHNLCRRVPIRMFKITAALLNWRTAAIHTRSMRFVGNTRAHNFCFWASLYEAVGYETSNDRIIQISNRKEHAGLRPRSTLFAVSWIWRSFLHYIVEWLNTINWTGCENARPWLFLATEKNNKKNPSV